MTSPVKPREWEKTLTVKCRLCGGSKCKRCSESAALAKTDSPVMGLHADWVTDRILGMMRPSTRLIKEYHIIQQFHKFQIKAVFNLTLPGEHPYCGDGLGSSGFPYDPETDLMKDNIRFYNFGWEDMTTPTLSFMLDIVKVMTSILEDGNSKVAVHCHAGYGRTGLAIACCLIFIHGIPPDRAIKIVRRDRPGSIQTSAQSKFVRSFYEYIYASKVVFALPYIHERFCIEDIVDQQNRMVHGVHGTRCPIPRVLDFLCSEIERVVETNTLHVLQSFINHPQTLQSSVSETAQSPKPLRETASDLQVKAPIPNAAPPPPGPANVLPSTNSNQYELFQIKVAFNVGEWNWSEAVQLCTSIGHFPALLLDWLEHLDSPLLAMDIISQVNSDIDSKWRCINQLPSYTVKSLHRFVLCCRALLHKAESISHSSVSSSSHVSPLSSLPLSEGLCSRIAMALFHISGTILPKYTAFVSVLIREWHPPKRLELNLESIQKMGRTLSTRRSSQSSGSFKGISDPMTTSPSKSPSKTTDTHGFETVVCPRIHPTENLHVSSTEETSPLRIEFPIRLPSEGTPKSKDHSRHSESSPVKIEPLIPRINVEVPKDFDTIEPNGLHSEAIRENRSSEKDLASLMIPTTPKLGVVHSPNKHLVDPIIPPSSSSTSPTSLTRSPTESNQHALPSVRGGDRYKSNPRL